MKKTRIRFFKFSDGKQNLQFHWPNRKRHDRIAFKVKYLRSNLSYAKTNSITSFHKDFSF
jgi:hypothetical protein